MNRSKLCLSLLAVIYSGTLFAQNGSGSTSISNSQKTTIESDSTFEYAESLYIGPDAVWEINGVHTVYSKNIWIAPDAKINGNGKLIIANPADNPFYTFPSGPTYIDGNNGNFITLNLEHHNPGNIILSDIADPGFATLNPSGPLSAALKIGSDFSFEIHNADVILNGNDFIFGANGTVSNYGPYRMVVTDNSIAGHMVKENTISGSFIFPVGIAERDYTPAIVSGINNYHVSVQNYAASASVETDPANGIDRTWHIYGGVAGNVRLQHNSPLTDGALYDDITAFITRYLGDWTWSSGVPEQSQTGVHTNTVTIGAGVPVSGNADAAYLSKTSNTINPLPVKLLSFFANKEDKTVVLDWLTASEQNNKGFEIERSKDGKSWASCGYVASLAIDGNSTTKLEYRFTDKQPLNGQNYYRLKQWNLDGNFNYSPVRNILFEREDRIQLYPNPVKDKLQLTGLSGNESIDLYNVSGSLVYHQKADREEFTLSLSQLSCGVYYIRISNQEGYKSVHKLVKAD